MSRVLNRTGRILDRLFGTRPADPVGAKAPKDRFREFADIDGPVLVGGPVVRHDPGLDGSRRTVVLMPHLTLDRMSGGPNTIFQVTARLLEHGERLVYVAAFRGLSPDRESVLQHIGAVTGIDLGEADVELVDASSPGSVVHVGIHDVLVATWWPTAHVAHAGLREIRAREFIYLIQDFEPGFYPWSTKYALAAATYDMPARAIVNEPFLLEHIVGATQGRFEGADQAIAFLPAVDSKVFASRAPGRTGPVGLPSTRVRRMPATCSSLACGPSELRRPRACSMTSHGTCEQSVTRFRNSHCHWTWCCVRSLGWPTANTRRSSVRPMSSCR